MTQPRDPGNDSLATNEPPELRARRTERLAVVAVLVAMVVLVGGAAAIARSGRAGRPASQEIGEDSAPNASVTVAIDTGTPPAAPVVSASGSASAAAAATPDSQPTTQAARPSHSPTPTCQPNGYVELTRAVVPPAADAAVRVQPDLNGSPRLCPGERIRVFWASYLDGDDGLAHLIGSGEYWLDATHSSVDFHLTLAADQCKNAWYLARGTDPIPATVPVGVQPFAHPMNWNSPSTEASCQPRA